ncbi:MAG: lipopolysaccharide core heptose(I) kinase RfaP [Rhodocyclaceae bacterium]|jgi:heptose I phosphotransferase|nr:Lipopolysaccharide core heptose(I) kinase RfaP [Rhodocyclaceae bacterium]MBZ0142143.1 lipopolysaccharide core heptose(I) kinase RfaP [Rhodocyclaceae bacterium]MCL4679636.1 lipopolysaccharide core heptose(I) kinase RfaP [Rhodocyclaceae bacterium]
MNQGAGKARERPSPPPVGRGTGGGPIVYLDEPFRTLWAGQDPFRAAAALQGTVLRELEGRRTLRTEVGGRGYYVKLHRGVGWGEIFKNLATARLPVLGAEHEWQAIRRLTELGVDTMKAVAFGRRGSNPARLESFIVTEELAPTVSLEDYCRDWPTQPPAPALKRALIARVAQMAGRMHRGGVNHRDCYICHFLLHTEPAPTPEQLRLSLIDLHRAQVRASAAGRRGRPATPRRWRDKDLAALHFSTLEIGLTARDRLRFLRAYFGRPLREVLDAEADLLAYLGREGERLMERYRRKYAPHLSHPLPREGGRGKGS